MTLELLASKYLAKLPWRIATEEEASCYWSNAAAIMDANGSCVAVLTRGYQGDENGDCPSYDNAKLIVEAVNRLALSAS